MVEKYRDTLQPTSPPPSSYFADQKMVKSKVVQNDGRLFFDSCPQTHTTPFKGWRGEGKMNQNGIIGFTNYPKFKLGTFLIGIFYPLPPFKQQPFISFAHFRVPQSRPSVNRLSLILCRQIGPWYGEYSQGNFHTKITIFTQFFPFYLFRGAINRVEWFTLKNSALAGYMIFWTTEKSH